MPRHSTSAPATVAYSYIRFSHPSQAEGDSVRRQTDAAAKWCQRNAIHLDTATTFRDLGRSAYTGSHRTNPDRNALAAFLKLVEQGKIARGAYLIIENLDRLSREHIQPALLLALNLLQAGIRIVQLTPTELVFDDSSDTLPVMMMMMELSRGHSESAIKSERVKAAWEERRRQTRENGTILTRALPAWIEERDGKLHLIEERAAVIKRIFQLRAAGYGCSSIVKRLTTDGVPPFGQRVLRPGMRRSQFSGRWTVPYVAMILADRRVVGELQPMTRRKKKQTEEEKRQAEGKDKKRPDRRPEGEPIKGYYPAAVTEEEFWAARGKSGRAAYPSRVGKYSNLFAGLIRHARDGSNYITCTKKTRVLISFASVGGYSPCWSFPLDTFERCILDRLREINAKDILNGDEPPDDSEILRGQLERVEASISMIGAEMDQHGESPALFRRLRAKEDEQAELTAKLAEAREKASHPLSESWGECQSLAQLLDQAEQPDSGMDLDDIRMRLRAAIRRVVSEVWILVVPRPGTAERLCAVQMHFADRPARRSYLIYYRAAGRGREKVEDVRSLAEVAKPGARDLRRPEDAAKLEALLAEIDLPDLADCTETA
jgi:DNA invertase Pin-like site-specific DNA recombinase